MTEQNEQNEQQEPEKKARKAKQWMILVGPEADGFDLENKSPLSPQDPWFLGKKAAEEAAVEELSKPERDGHEAIFLARGGKIRLPKQVKRTVVRLS